MKKLPLILTAVLALMSVGAFAQEEVIYNQYHFNYYLINPAVAGADKCSHIMLTAKYDLGATEALSFRTRLADKNVGLGGYIYNDQTPNFRNTGLQFTFAYHIPMSKGARYLRDVQLDRQLSFGVSIKAHQTAYTSHGTPDPADVSDSEIVPDANVGVYYTSYGFFTGLSVTNMVPYEMSIYQAQSNPLTAFFFIGHSFDIGKDRKLEPSVNFNYNSFSFKQFELNLKYSQINPYENYGFWGQLSYRHNIDDGFGGQAISLIPIIGARFNKFQLAYAYNIALNELGNSPARNFGGHELMLAYTFCIPKEFCR